MLWCTRALEKMIFLLFCFGVRRDEEKETQTLMLWEKMENNNFIQVAKGNVPLRAGTVKVAVKRGV